MIPLSWWLVVSALLLAIGLYAALSHKNLIGILMGVELILNAVNINIVAFWRYINPGDIAGQVFVIVVIAVAAAEVAVGLAIVLDIYRRRQSAVAEELDILRN